MRSRYAAYACGDVDYLVKTLHPDHKDREIPEEVLRSSLRAACRDYRYTGLEIVSVETDGDWASVHFKARVFQKGVDLSFSERSRFERVGGGWRYLDGETER
jgi:SEC-C motif domain protein